MRADSVTTNERARWPTPRAMNMYDMRHLAPSTGRRTNEGIQPAAQLIVSSVGIGQLYSLICIRDVVKRRKPEVFLKTLFVWKCQHDAAPRSLADLCADGVYGLPVG